jgi:uncharacterized membrane protein SpoIIM required for sporulation
MRETRFIEQNQEKWREYEQLLRDDVKDSEKLGELFVQVTEDFSYARTFYPNRMVRMFLNGMAQRIFHKIHRNRRSSMGRFIRFWTHDVPQMVFEARFSFYTAFGIFMLAFSIGAISTQLDPEFPRLILGDAYVDMTLENIEKGDPMAVYKDRGAFGMSIGIATNNLFVALLTYTFGAIWGLGTLFFLLFNGVMVGAFQWFFVQKGVGIESFLTIWIHGALEISAIVIAAAAGFEMARGLLFPRTLTRVQAFRISANRGLKIFISITPVLLLAAFFEGFLTRHTDLPNVLRGSFIAFSFFFVAFYFVWLPWFRSRNVDFLEKTALISLRSTTFEPLEMDKLRTSGEIFSESFSLFIKNGSKWLGIIITTAMISCAFMVTFGASDWTQLFQNQTFSAFVWMDTALLFSNEKIPFLTIFQSILVSFLAFFTFHFVKEAKKATTEPAETYPNFIIFIQIFAVIFPVLWLYGNWSETAVRCVFLPFLVVAGVTIATVFYEKTNAFSAFWRTLTLMGTDFWKGYLLSILWILMGFLACFFVNSVVFSHVFKLILWNISLPADRSDDWMAAMHGFLSLAILYTIFVLWMTSSAILFYALREIHEARGLEKEIKKIGSGRVIRGLARE